MKPTLLKLYLKLLPASDLSNKRTSQANQGFVIPLFIGIGLIMTGVGLAMIARSSDNQQTSILQKQSAQSLAVAETGVTEIMQFINKVRPLADDSLSNWQTEYEAVQAICSDDYAISAAKDYKEKNWISTNKGQDRFRVRDYQYTANDPTDINSSGIGKLTIEGQANFNQNASISVVEVGIPVSTATQGTPGLFVTQANLSNNEVDGDLLLYDCDFSGSNIDTSNITGDARANPFAEFPPLPELPATINTEYKDSGSTTSLSQGIKSSLFTGGATTIEFPGSDDIADSDGVYHYLLGASGTGNSIDLKGGGKTVTIKAGEKVRFYLEGNVQMKGNAKLVHDCTGTSGCKPTNFQIYGGDGLTNTYNGNMTTSICLSGGSTVDAFIFAPEANVAVNGGGNNVASDGTNDESGQGITGSVWAKSWNDDPTTNSCGSNAGKILVTQNANWNDLPIARPRIITSPSSWERQKAN